MEENARCFSVSLCKDWLHWINDNDLSSTYSVYSKARVHPSSTYFHISVISSHYCHPMSLNVIIIQYATLPLSVSHVSHVPNILIAAANELANLDLPSIVFLHKSNPTNLPVSVWDGTWTWYMQHFQGQCGWRPGCLRTSNEDHVFDERMGTTKAIQSLESEWTHLQNVFELGGGRVSSLERWKPGSNQPKHLTSSVGTPFAIQRRARLLQ